MCDLSFSTFYYVRTAWNITIKMKSTVNNCNLILYIALIYFCAAQYPNYIPRESLNCLKCTKTRECHQTHLILDMILWKEVLTPQTTKGDCLFLLWVKSIAGLLGGKSWLSLQRAFWCLRSLLKNVSLWTLSDLCQSSRKSLVQSRQDISSRVSSEEPFLTPQTISMMQIEMSRCLTTRSWSKSGSGVLTEIMKCLQGSIGHLLLFVC